MRHFSFASIILITSLLSSFLRADEVKLLIWEENFSSDLIKRFEDKSGHTVSLTYFENEMIRDEIVYTGKAKVYDLFILDGYTLSVFMKEGILRKIDNSILNVSNRFTIDSNSACKEYGIPYAYGSMGIGYRSSQVDMQFSSWMDIFDYAKQEPGKLVLPYEDIDTIAIALLALGYHPMTSSEQELKEAYHLLDGVIDSLLALSNSAGYALEKRNKSEMDVAVFYSGEKTLISNATGHDDWEYVIPNEGTLMWFECLASHIDKQMSKATLEFLEFIIEPRNAGKNAQDIWFATANKEALNFTSKEYHDDKELFPVGMKDKKIYHYEHIDAASLSIRANILAVLLGKK
ncbi:extracellular solute-binding protein [Marinomonas primoryensis]|uniref:extracellular solute-binding protein n=1 Tax=Marinomonas primoryensis TaxID=178399 RepID=UPI0030DCB945|tara:strand:- start:3179 stop:4219 length:1041 start_codon:yes stop_codon:yes gene_type:complete